MSIEFVAFASIIFPSVIGIIIAYYLDKERIRITKLEEEIKKLKKKQ